MWAALVWVVVTWVKLTAGLAAVVGVCWLAFGSGSGWFTLAVIGAVVVELFVIRQLGRELAHEAGLHWWAR